MIMDKKLIMAIVAILAVALVAVAAYAVMSGDDDDEKEPAKEGNDDGNDEVPPVEPMKFLIQDKDGIYFWVSGTGDNAMEAFEDALSAYPEGTLTKNNWGGIGSLFGWGTTQNEAGDYVYWGQFIWSDGAWAENQVGMAGTNSADVDYMAIVYTTSTAADGLLLPEGTPTPEDAVIYDGSTAGTVFQIKSGTGMYFWINGEGGDNLLDTFKNACEKYKIEVKTSTWSTGDALSGIFGWETTQDEQGNWLYWQEFGKSADGWVSSDTGMSGLTSAENPEYALVWGAYGDDSAIPN